MTPRPVANTTPGWAVGDLAHPDTLYPTSPSAPGWVFATSFTVETP